MHIDSLINNSNINFNEQQKKAIRHIDGPAIVLAVPGAGKTTVLIYRTANLIINHKINPTNILSLTFSKSSARDMKNKFINLFGQVCNNIHFSTIHSFAFMLIRRYSQIQKTNYTLIEDNKSKINKNALLRQIHKQINNTYVNEDKMDELLNNISYIKNMMVPNEDIYKHKQTTIKNFTKIFNTYEKVKKDNNYIDFDDMLALALEILKNNPKILTQYKNHYRYIQVDEGQDNSNLQNEIIKLISFPTNNLFVVADDDQSIYGFRGASPESLLNFNKIYPNAKTYFMEQNYRSTQNIVDVSNDFISINSDRYKKNMHTINITGTPVNIIKIQDEYKQLEYLINKLKKSDELSSTAILYRNNISSVGLVHYLKANDIPYYIRENKMHFFKHWLVADIAAFLKLSLDNSDKKSFERIYYKMNGYISKSALKYSFYHQSSNNVFDNLLEYPDFKSFQKENILRLKNDFKHLSKKNGHDALEFILNKLDYQKYLNENCKKLGYSLDNASIVLSNLKIIASSSNSIIEFLSTLTNLFKTFNISNARNKGVKLSTIHSSKGLEYKNVYIIDLIDGDFPSTSCIDELHIGNKKPLEEERRLFYVGMTRAKETLSLITIKSRNDKVVYQSRFLDELESIVSETNEEDYINTLGLKKGASVHHNKFGLGKIKSINQDTVSIDFNSCGIKKLSVQVCLKQNLLKVI